MRNWLPASQPTLDGRPEREAAKGSEAADQRQGALGRPAAKGKSEAKRAAALAQFARADLLSCAASSCSSLASVAAPTRALPPLGVDNKVAQTSDLDAH